ncbi:MAG: hypothetical protein KBA86_04505 [Bacteroidales bacterium]|nr:hypothetical protein [Bacteroidales bacterium]
MLEKKWIILLLLMQYIFCNAQEEIITSYQNKELKKLNIVLNGKVKQIKQITYSPDKLCDTISSFIDDADNQTMHSGRLIEIKCSCDTIIYYFNSNLSPTLIKDINFHIDKSNRRTHKETVYLFENGNLISKISSNNGKTNIQTTYKYDLNNNLIVKIEDLSSVVMIDSLEYDDNNNLIKKRTYRHGIMEQYVLGKNKKLISESSLYESAEYEYDAFNHLISKTRGNNIGKDIYIYDTLGNKIEQGYCKNYKGAKCKYAPSQGFVYDENNRKIKSFSIGDWKPHNTDEYYQYDEHGREIEVKGYYIYNKKDTVIGFHFIYEYDELGQEVKKEVLVGGPFFLSSLIFKECSKLITTYDKHKNITQQKLYTSDNQIVDIICFVYEYDSYGNWIKKEEYRGKNEDELLKMNVKERILEYY